MTYKEFLNILSNEHNITIKKHSPSMIKDLFLGINQEHDLKGQMLITAGLLSLKEEGFGPEDSSKIIKIIMFDTTGKYSISKNIEELKLRIRLGLDN